MAASDASHYQGDFIAWPGGCVLIGEGSGSIAPHAHYAIQIAIGAPDGLRVLSGKGDDWLPCAGAIVPSRAVHSIDVNACDWSAVIFVEPETEAGRAIAARLAQGIECLEPAVVSRAAAGIEDAWRVQRDALPLIEACARFVRELSGTEAREPSDPRVLAAVDFISERVAQPIALEDVARVAHLSPSRFRHLFVAETGMPLRAYVLWRRLLHVWTLLMAGESLAAAAHASGFADSAHLSRTARTMFGLPPSVLQMGGPISSALRLRQGRRHFG